MCVCVRLRAPSCRQNCNQTVQGVADGAGASTLPKQRDEAEAARHPSAATVAGGRALEPAGVVREPFVGHISSGIGPSAGAECGGDLARVVGGEDSQRCEAGCAKGKHERSQKPSGPTPSPKVRILRRVDHGCFAGQV